MALKFQLNTPDETLLEAVEKRIDLLVKEEYKKALDFIEHDNDSEWTPELLKEWINNYGDYDPHYSGEIFKVTSIDTVNPNNSKHYRDLDYFDEPILKEKFQAEIIAEIWYDLPLNNEWSDLTAAFFVLKREEYLTLLLNDIHLF